MDHHAYHFINLYFSSTEQVDGECPNESDCDLSAGRFNTNHSNPISSGNFLFSAESSRQDGQLFSYSRFG